jgi:hypothetical protein
MWNFIVLILFPTGSIYGYVFFNKCSRTLGWFLLKIVSKVNSEFLSKSQSVWSKSKNMSYVIFILFFKIFLHHKTIIIRFSNNQMIQILISKLSPAILSFLVICLSASLGTKVPDGWLWQRINPVTHFECILKYQPHRQCSCNTPLLSWDFEIILWIIQINNPKLLMRQFANDGLHDLEIILLEVILINSTASSVLRRLPNSGGNNRNGLRLPILWNQLIRYCYFP